MSGEWWVGEGSGEGTYRRSRVCERRIRSVCRWLPNLLNRTQTINQHGLRNRRSTESTMRTCPVNVGDGLTSSRSKYLTIDVNISSLCVSGMEMEHSRGSPIVLRWDGCVFVHCFVCEVEVETRETFEYGLCD